MAGTRKLRESLRALFSVNGGRLSIEELLRRAMDKGLITEEDFRTTGVKYYLTVIRDALRMKGIDDLPFAISSAPAIRNADEAITEDDYPWIQLSLALYDEDEQHFHRCLNSIDTDVKSLQVFHKHMIERFGKVPFLPLFSRMDEDEGLP